MNEIALNLENFDKEVIAAVKPVLVDFYAPWCGPCQVMSTVVSEIADMSQGKYLVGKVNVEEESELANRFGVRSVPTFKVFNDGLVTASVMGVVKKEKLLQMLNS